MFLFWIKESFSIFGISIAWYAICILIGIILAVWAGITEGKKIGIPSDDIYVGVLIIVPLSIMGARIWYILFNLDDGWTFKRIIGLDGGLAGLAIQGGVIAALISVYTYCRVRQIKLYRILDVVAPGFLIGQICGRWGNFCNHELYGPVVKNPGFLKNIPILGENMYINGAYRHPTFLYESVLNLVGLGVMFLLRRKFKKLKSGDLIGVYGMWYGSVRIITEILRSKSGANEILMLGPIPVSIAISVLFIVSGAAYLVIKRFFGPQEYYQDIMKTVAENKLDTILFDLDGTLLNTRKLIDRSFTHTFEHFRPDLVLTEEDLDSFFGPSLKQTFSRYSEDPEEIDEMIKYYRAFNVSMHDEMVTVFPGAKEVLQTLHRKGYKLGVVSSKKTDLVEHGLELFGLLKYMDVVVGEEDVKNNKPAPDGILMAMEKLGGEKAAYVGDTLSDMQAGHAAGIKTIGVLYIKDPEIMLEAKPDYVITKLSEIIRICVE